MSGVRTNSELLVAGYDAWNRDDCEAWLELLEPDAEISTSGVFPDLSAVYRGHGEATRFWRQLHAPWETFRIDVEHVGDEGDCALAAIRFSLGHETTEHDINRAAEVFPSVVSKVRKLAGDKQ